MDKKRLRELAEQEVDNFFETEIDEIVANKVSKLVENENIKDDDEINYLKKKIMRGILKLD